MRKLGRLPKESQSKSREEQLLARDLREAKASGLLKAFGEELQELASDDHAAEAASTAAEHAQRAEALMRQVRKLGRLPKESQSKPREEQLLARGLREAKATGLLKVFEEE